MKKSIIAVFTLLLSASLTPVLALDTVFDSMDNATEVRLAPVVTTQDKSSATTIKEQKFNNAIVNLDDAQVELRQDLTDATSRYNEALTEKERVIANCKSIKKEIKDINTKMRNVEKSKKIINKNLESEK